MDTSIHGRQRPRDIIDNSCCIVTCPEGNSMKVSVGQSSKISSRRSKSRHNLGSVMERSEWMLSIVYNCLKETQEHHATKETRTSMRGYRRRWKDAERVRRWKDPSIRSRRLYVRCEMKMVHSRPWPLLISHSNDGASRLLRQWSNDRAHIVGFGSLISLRH